MYCQSLYYSAVSTFLSVLKVTRDVVGDTS